jgi:hypothetical protein
MKYGIEARLPAAAVDLVQRFHAAMLLRIHQVQQGAVPAVGNHVDTAIAAMHRWDGQQQPAGSCPPCNHSCNEGRDCPARKPAAPARHPVRWPSDLPGKHEAPSDPDGVLGTSNDQQEQPR